MTTNPEVNRKTIDKTDAILLAEAADTRSQHQGVRWLANELQLSAARILDSTLGRAGIHASGGPVALSCWPLARVLRAIDMASEIEIVTFAPDDTRVVLVLHIVTGHLLFQVED